jgi:hypothetical protein
MNVRSVCLSSLSLLACACGGSGATTEVPPSPAVEALVLAKEPAGAVAVIAAKQKGAAEAIVVTGRVGEMAKGLAQFQLMDVSIPYCGEVNKEDKCRKPWDYCCETRESIATNSFTVEARDASGAALRAPSLGIRQCDRVAVTGKLQKDEHGNFLLLASGWFRQERPQLPDYVQFPQ